MGLFSLSIFVDQEIRSFCILGDEVLSIWCWVGESQLLFAQWIAIHKMTPKKNIECGVTKTFQFKMRL